ncbi:MAG: hypothetical protein AABY16_01940 [Nanoarchaeota archaeon]
MGITRKELYSLISVITILIVITFLTRFYGGADILDYSDSAKFFADKYAAKIRSSHSYVYGLLHAIPISLTEGFFFFKITSLFSLLLIVYSVYRITNKNKKALWLMLLSPIVWYMAPWISPIQTASLFFLWSHYFIRKYDHLSNVKYLLYAGLLAGLSWAFWDGVLFFIPFFALSFLYNKKLSHFIYFIILVLVGSMPRLILDQILFGFAFLGILRHILASLTIALYGGIYSQSSLIGLSKFIITFVFIPIFSYLLFTKKIIKENKKTATFLIFSIIIIILNSQVRFSLFVVPIIIASIAPYLSHKQFVLQIAISLILILLVINPYLIQLRYSTNFSEFGAIPYIFPDIKLNSLFVEDLIKEDLKKVTEEYPNKTFVVGNNYESYRFLANIYWGDKVKEFVSIEDYKLNNSNNPKVFEKEFCSHIKISERRDFCTSVYIRKSFKDQTDYNKIEYALSDKDSLDLEGFSFVKKYKYLSLFKKSQPSA